MVLSAVAPALACLLSERAACGHEQLHVLARPFAHEVAD